MRKNANLKSAKEALLRMLNGERFYLYPCEFYWCEERKNFVFFDSQINRVYLLKGLLKHYDKFLTEYAWYECIDPIIGVLCYHDKLKCIQHIIKYNNTGTCTSWENTIIPVEELSPIHSESLKKFYESTR